MNSTLYSNSNTILINALLPKHALYVALRIFPYVKLRQRPLRDQLAR